MRSNCIFITSLLFSIIICIAACQTEHEINYQRYYVNGKGLYESHCQNCHGADGKGLKLLYPPLTEKAFLAKNKPDLACIIKFGMKGKLIIEGKEFDGSMPANNQLSDIDIAQIIVYISNSFGNKQGFYDAARVTADLKECQ